MAGLLWHSWMGNKCGLGPPKLLAVAILPPSMHLPSSTGLVSPHHPMDDVPAPCGALRVARSLQNPPSTQDEAVWRQQGAHTLQGSLLLALLRASGPSCRQIWGHLSDWFCCARARAGCHPARSPARAAASA